MLLHRDALVGVLLVFTISVSTKEVSARGVEDELSDVSDQIKSIQHLESDEKSEFDFIAAPVPIGNPTVGTGIAGVGAFLFQVDPKSQSSFVGFGGGYTDNGSWGIGAAQSLFFNQDLLNIDASLVYATVTYDFFGVGVDAGDTGRSITLEQTVFGGTLKGKVRVAPSTYMGAQAWYFDIDTSVPIGRLGTLFPNLNPVELKMHNVGVGFLADYDTRDNRFDPKRGVYAQFAANYGLTDIGDSFNFQFDYQKVELNVNHYVNVIDGDTLALRASSCSIWGQAPLFDLCLFGAKSDLRGYVSGQYRDRAMFAAQAEYRRDLFWRIGTVAFVGVGGVAEDLASFSKDELLPSVGGGIRVNLSEEFGVNFGVDYAYGRDSDAIYFRVGEAF